MFCQKGKEEYSIWIDDNQSFLILRPQILLQINVLVQSNEKRPQIVYK